MKRVLALVVALAVCVSGAFALADVGTEDSGSDAATASAEAEASYEYEAGHEQLSNFDIVDEYEAVYSVGLAADLPEATYTVTGRQTTICGTSWDIAVEDVVGADLGTIQSELLEAGDYDESLSVTLEDAAQWESELGEAGTYQLSWYMRGHKYDAYCGTRTDDGQYADKYLGTVVFPADEFYYAVEKVA